MTDPSPADANAPHSVSPELLLHAYTVGVFPMADPDEGTIDWYRPDPRGILPLDAFHVPKSLARRVGSGRFTITTDRAFETVMRACAEPRSDDNGSWMVETLLQAYLVLHAHGFAHSVEAWRVVDRDATGARIEPETRLVGGLYGVHVGGAFFGESMFSRPEDGGTDASKVCLVHLVERLRAHGFTLLDTQFVTDHLTRFGAVEIPAEEYERRLAEALELDRRWDGEAD